MTGRGRVVQLIATVIFGALLLAGCDGTTTAGDASVVAIDPTPVPTSHHAAAQRQAVAPAGRKTTPRATRQRAARRAALLRQRQARAQRLRAQQIVRQRAARRAAAHARTIARQQAAQRAARLAAQRAAARQRAAQRAAQQASNCTPGYSPCVPVASDVDCAGGSGNGPAYVEGPITVTGDDPYGLDSDHDGIGCEN